MRYHFKLRREKKGYSAFCIELDGCLSQGETMDELRSNLEEALDVYLSEPMESSLLFALPNKKLRATNSVIEIQVNPGVAFAMMLRHFRIKNQLTQAAAAKKIGITGSLWTYQRLETPGKANPTLSTLERVKRAYPDFPIADLVA